eukprot:GHVQ01024166.1.p1 GENE.GHVQ01024166.1~~GHVQ01024166.1.p1  ORF type:complete len:175 (-),score=35.73 GHVQ01024166.1:290-814(-)
MNMTERDAVDRDAAVFGLLVAFVSSPLRTPPDKPSTCQHSASFYLTVLSFLFVILYYSFSSFFILCVCLQCNPLLLCLRHHTHTPSPRVCVSPLPASPPSFYFALIRSNSPHNRTVGMTTDHSPSSTLLPRLTNNSNKTNYRNDAHIQTHTQSRSKHTQTHRDTKKHKQHHYTR